MRLSRNLQDNVIVIAASQGLLIGVTVALWIEKIPVWNWSEESVLMHDVKKKKRKTKKKKPTTYTDVILGVCVYTLLECHFKECHFKLPRRSSLSYKHIGLCLYQEHSLSLSSKRLESIKLPSSVILSHKVKKQYVHFRSHAYCLFFLEYSWSY